eukprot:COSAG01_NODE_18951_length_1041_cov_2.385350_1_plen_55_part_10
MLRSGADPRLETLRGSTSTDLKEGPVKWQRGLLIGRGGAEHDELAPPTQGGGGGV